MKGQCEGGRTPHAFRRRLWGMGDGSVWRGDTIGGRRRGAPGGALGERGRVQPAVGADSPVHRKEPVPRGPGRRLPICTVLKNHHRLCPCEPVLQVFSLAAKNRRRQVGPVGGAIRVDVCQIEIV